MDKNLELVPSPPEEHAFASPSKLEILEICPYAAWQCKDWESPRSEASLRGATLHQAVYNREVFDKLDKADQELVRQIQEYCVSPYTEGYKIHYEQRLSIADDITKEEVTFGTCDELIVRDDGKLVIINDYKFGTFPVPLAANNLQCYAYAVAAFQKYPECDKVFAEVIQPSEGLSSDHMVCFTREEDYVRLYTRVVNIVRRAVAARSSDAVPTPDTCRFCRKDCCKAYQEAMKAGLDCYCDALTTETPDLPMPELVNWCDSKLQQISLAETYLKEISNKLKAVVIANNGSATYRVCQGRVQKNTDWASICKEYEIPREVIESYTTEKKTAPYLIRKSSTTKR